MKFLPVMLASPIWRPRTFTTRFHKSKEGVRRGFQSRRRATFFVTHSHEKMSTDDIVDYCRGWLHLGKDGVEFVPAEGAHGFKLKYPEIAEFKQNRFSRRERKSRAIGCAPAKITLYPSASSCAAGKHAAPQRVLVSDIS